MAQIINTNIASLNAQRNLSTSGNANATALERLSSGLRINSAKDDAAGLAISTRFESQTRGLGQAVRNAGDGVSLAQTAEGALQSMTDNLQRIRELAVQSANGTNSDDDRIALQAEVKQLVAEIERTSEETNFNGRALFDGSFDGIFQIGANAGQTVGVEIGQLTVDRMGASDQVGVSAFGTSETLSNGDLIINGVAIGAARSGDDTASTANATGSAISTVEAINRYSDETGVTAFVNDNVAAGSIMTGESTNGTVTINGVDIEISTSSNTANSRASVVEAINAESDQTGVRAVNTDSASNGVQLVAEDGRNIQISFDDTNAQATGLAEAGTYEGGYTLIADGDRKEIRIDGGDGTGRGDLRNAGLTAGTFTRAVASSVSESVAELKEAASVGNQTEGTVTLGYATDFATDIQGTDFSAGTNDITLTFVLNGEALEDDTITIDEDGATFADEQAYADYVSGLVDAAGLSDQIEVSLNDDDELVFTAVGFGSTLEIYAEDGAGADADEFRTVDDDFETAGGNGVSVGGVDGTTLQNPALLAGENIAYTVQVGKETYEGVIADDQTMAQAATTIRDLDDGINAWEEINLTFDTEDAANPFDPSGFEAGDTVTFTLGTGDPITVTLSEDDEGDVTLATIVSDFNSTNFGSDLQVSATLSEDSESFDLVIRNFSEESVQFGSTLSGGTFDSTIGDLGTNFASGVLAFSSAGDQDVSVNLADPDEGTNFFAGSEVSDTYNSVNGLRDGDLVINGVAIGPARTSADTASASVSSDGARILSSSKELSAIAVAASINQVSNETGVSATVNATRVVGGDGENADPESFNVGDEAAIYINGVSVGTVTLQADGDGDVDTDRARADALNLINQNSGKTGVVAEDNGVSLTMTAQDGRNISIAIDDRSGSEQSIGALFGMDSAVDGIGEVGFGTGSLDSDYGISAEALAYETTYGTVTLESAGQFTIEGGSNGAEALRDLGLRVGTFGGGEDGQFLRDIDVSTFEGATAAITAVDNALTQVSAARSELGAIQNRFESTIGNLEITRENLTAANSRIRDADFAAESAELSRTQVLQQAGISILAQANQRPQQALTLLG